MLEIETCMTVGEDHYLAFISVMLGFSLGIGLALLLMRSLYARMQAAERRASNAERRIQYAEELRRLAMRRLGRMQRLVDDLRKLGAAMPMRRPVVEDEDQI